MNPHKTFPAWGCLMSVLAMVAASGPAAAFKELGGKWDPLQGPVEYTISSIGSDDIPDDTDTLAIEYAFRSWECVLCSNVQFRFVGDGPNEVSGQDNKNAMFFLEDAQSWQAQTGAGVDSVLGVTIHHDASGTYSAADIAFNGTHTWSTADNTPATDIESVALHEAGHFLGLGHPCTDANETNCLPANEAVMAPAYPGGDARTPHADDINGICAVYPTPKDSCSGRKRLKEECTRDCECETNLLCIPDGDKRMCSRGCGRPNDPSCPTGTACALGGNSGGEVGVCVRNAADGTRADGTVCTRSGPDPRCTSGECARSRTAEKFVCANFCQADSECSAGYACMEGLCLLPTVDRGVACPEEDDGGGGRTGCSNARADAGFYALLAVAWAARRRRARG